MLHQLNTYFSKVDLRFYPSRKWFNMTQYLFSLWVKKVYVGYLNCKQVWIFDHLLEVETILTHAIFVTCFFGATVGLWIHRCVYLMSQFNEAHYSLFTIYKFKSFDPSLKNPTFMLMYSLLAPIQVHFTEYSERVGLLST